MLSLKTTESSLNTLPLFFNHESARMFFKREYGKLFVMVDSNVIDNVKHYTYHIVHDKLIYIKSMNAIREGSPFIQSEFENSYETLEISEEGFIFFNNRRK